MPANLSSPLIAAVARRIIEVEDSHTKLNNLFTRSGVPDEPPRVLSKLQKATDWLARLNTLEGPDALVVLGRVIKGIMDVDLTNYTPDYEALKSRRDEIEQALQRERLQYFEGGRIVSLSTAAPASRTLQQIIDERSIPEFHREIERSLDNVESEPRQAISAASNILETLFKTYIDREGLSLPANQDMSHLWNTVKPSLGLEPSRAENGDLRTILSGLNSIVQGVGSLRTHASSAHGHGPQSFPVEPRHARLAVHAAHTVSTFILESWPKAPARR